MLMKNSTKSRLNPAPGLGRLSDPLQERAKQTTARLFNPVLIGGCIIIMANLGIRASYGVFRIPVAADFGWPRSDFSLAIAVQNLAWGFGQPVFGASAERIGDRRAVVGGALLYALGLVSSAFATQPVQHQLLEILVGFGIAGTGFGVILAVVGRAASTANRSVALGIVTAAGSAGQVIGAPIAAGLMTIFPWQTVFVIFAAAILAVLMALPLMRALARTGRPGPEESLTAVVLRALRALRDPSFTMIFLGFFSCGYQLAVIAAHFPAFVAETWGAIDPAGILAGLGVGSTATLVPVTPTTVVLFSLAMGALWLATVPLTSGLVAQIHGIRYRGTLYGIVFFSHQLGSFMAVWLGGKLYDMYGAYTAVWWIGVGIGAFSALVHLPIREGRLEISGAAA